MTVKILIVDDDVVSRMVLMHLVDGAGGGRCEVLEAEDGEDAWGQLAAGAYPDMLFCDLRMPRLDGMALLARLKADARFASIPFVLASAAGDAATMERALGLGAQAYIVKPFDAAKVGPHLARLFGVDAVDAAADEPAQAAARRLGIDSARLLIYLGGLQRQLAGAGSGLEAQLAAGQHEAAHATLERLGEGCRTLGLHRAAAGFAALRARAFLDPAGVARALAQAQESVRAQTDAIERTAR